MNQEFGLEEILFRVGESMGVNYVNPQFSYTSYTSEYDGGCDFKSFQREQNGNIVIEGAGFYIPDRIQENELAVEGFFAHEGGHVKKFDSKYHRAYLWIRERAERGNPFLTIPTLVLYALVENQVDRIAINDGHYEAIKELRKYIKNRVEIKF